MPSNISITAAMTACFSVVAACEEIRKPASIALARKKAKQDAGTILMAQF
jgi:hypothetical protein